MKKVDLLIISGLFVIILIAYFMINKQSNTNIQIQLLINNEVIEEIIIYEDNTYNINSDSLNIYIYKNNELLKTVNNKYQKNISNTIVVSNNSIKMTEANCKNKDCMYMEINDSKISSIICTNGIVIKTINNNFSDISLH